MLNLVKISNPDPVTSKFPFSLAVDVRIGLFLRIFLLWG